jgi:RecA/RadA recombinase
MPRKAKEETTYDDGRISFSPPGWLNTGLDILNYIIGGPSPGLPFGRLIRISGPPGVGKSSLAEHIAAEYLKNESGDVLLFEGEGKNHLEGYIKTAFGIADLKRLIGYRPPTLGSLWQQIENLSYEKDEGLWIIDSLSSFGEPDSKENKAGNMEIKPLTENQRLGLEAVKNTDVMKRGLYRRIADKKILIISINHLRDSIGYSGKHEPGGTANYYQSTIDMRLKSKQVIEDKAKDLVLGQDVEIEIVKNMVGPPFKKAIIPLYYGLGFDNCESIVNLCIKKGVLFGGGGWWKLENTEDAKKYRKYEVTKMLEEDQLLKRELLKRVLEGGSDE